jgi:hypothetical protein
MGAYKGPASSIKDAENRTDGFKKGGRMKKKCGGSMKKDMKDMKAWGDKSEDRADRPARKAGGSVFSSAASGTPRGKQSHY